MKYIIVLSIILLNVLNAEVNIVASQACKLETASKSDIKKLFMLKENQLNGESIKIVDRVRKPIYKKFLKTYLNKSLRRMKTYWVRMLFTGKKTPPKKLLLEELNLLCEDEKCYLSYIEEQEMSNMQNWKVLKIKWNR